jgi:hypothetical protein
MIMMIINNKEIKVAAWAWSLEEIKNRKFVLYQPVVVT